VAVDDRRGEVDQPAVVGPGAFAQHLKRRLFADGVALHQDSLRALDHGAPAEGTLQVVIFGEAAQDDVDRARPILDLVLGEVGEDAPLGGLSDELWVRSMQQDDHRACGGADDLVDELERVLRAVAESDQRDIGSFPRGQGTDVLGIHIPRDDLVAERDHDWGDEGEPVLGLVGDQNTQVVGRAGRERLRAYVALLLLPGFVTLAIYGAVFRLWPGMKKTPLAQAQFWTASAGAILLIIGAYFYATAGSVPLAALGSIVFIVASAMIVWQFWMHGHAA